MLSNELEYCLNDAFDLARKARHAYLTVEHLLLAILDTPKVREVLRACGADLAKLKQELRDHIKKWIPRLEEGEESEVQPSIGFQRVLQRAVFHVQSSGRKEVGVGNVLVAIFSEEQSHAVFLLNRQRITRLDVVNYISHGLSKIAEEKASEKDESSADGEREGEAVRIPGSNEGLEERLKSRFGSGLTVAIEPPELETCVAILMTKAQVAEVTLPEEVAFFIAQRIRSNVRELEGALRRVIANSRFTGRAITLEFTKEALKDLRVSGA